MCRKKTHLLGMDRQPPGHRENVTPKCCNLEWVFCDWVVCDNLAPEQRGKTAKPRVGVQWNSATGLQKINPEIELGGGGGFRLTKSKPWPVVVESRLHLCHSVCWTLSLGFLQH